MKRFLILLCALCALAAGCTREKGFTIKGDPYFSIVVLDDADIQIAALDEMTSQYTLSMTSDG